jgi:uncharacterized membrane-anchored protein
MAHPYNLYEPLHARPLIPVQTPQLVSVVAFLINQNTQFSEAVSSVQHPQITSNQDIEKLIESCYQAYECRPPQCPANEVVSDAFVLQKIIEKNRNKCMMQKHMNFFSIFFFTADDGISQKGLWSAIPDQIENNIINKAIFKTHIKVEKCNDDESVYYKSILAKFNNANADGEILKDLYGELFGSIVSDGGALAWTPFRCFADGYNRILIRNLSLGPERLGRLVRRLAEIDLYMALGVRNFNNAEQQLRILAAQESKLGDVVFSKNHEINNQIYNESELDRQSYKRITDIAKDLSMNVAETRYDFESTVAYSELVSRRVYELREQRLEGWTRIGFFLEKNYTPCVKTCDAVLRYQAALSQRIQEQASLLSAGLSFHVADKSKQILEQQRKTDEKESNFRITIELIALIAIVYYGAYLIDKVVFDQEISWIVGSLFIVSIITIILFTGYGKYISKRLRKVLDRLDPSA